MAIKKLNAQGMTIIELLIAVGIMAALASSVILARQFMAKQTQKTSDKIFATQKAIQMFEELRALAAQGGTAGFATLDNYNDGSNYQDILTTDKSVTAPGDPLSANKNIGYWKFWRQVSIVHVTQDPFARIVNVRVYGGLSGNKADTGTLLAEVGGILRITYSPVPPTQVYDVYALALSNELGWFTQVPNMLTAFESAVNAVTVINPGLIIRQHEISQTAFGRDFFYNPYINQAQDTITAVMPWIYFYAGNTPATSGSTSGTDTMFFNPAQLEAVGGINVDGTIKSDNGFSMCDMYNTGMRYPDEVAAYNAVSQSIASIPGSQPYQITLRMLLEQMNSQPASLTNPLIVSMHGEVLPLVNIRNYSDAAKDPLNASGSGGPNLRVVTHPDLVHYPSITAGSTRPVSLRVYAYYDGLLNPSNLDTTYSMATGTNIPVVPNITIYFPSLKFSTGDLNVTAISGGVTGGTNYRYTANNNLSSGAVNAVMNMYWTLTNPNGTDTLITLYNTPSRCATVIAGGVTTGLYPTQRLYNAEYIPCSVDTNKNYSTDLTTSASSANAKPVNTARWIISFKQASLINIPDGQYPVETRIGTSASCTLWGDYNYSTTPIGPIPSGSAAASELMADISRTYLWIGTGNNSGVTWGGSGVTPFTERYQYNGDPRHCPYLDCKFGSVALATQDSGTTIDSDSYNWYWEAIGNDNPSGNQGDGYGGFLKSTAGFNGQPTGTGTYGDMRDLPRYYYTYRRGLLQTTGVFTNLNGWTCWHASEGGEIGGTYDPFASSLKYLDTPWDPADTAAPSTRNIDEVQDSNNWNPTAIGGVTVHTTARDVMYNNGKSLNAATNWYAKWWLGEMYPDLGGGVTNYAAMWVTVGNLPTTYFWRVPFEAITATGDTNGLDLGRHLQWGVGSVGPAAFMNGAVGTSGAATNYSLASDGGGGVGNQSDITNLGVNLYNTTNFVMGSPVSAANTRPWNCYFDLSQDGSKMPPNWTDSYYKGLRTILSVPSVPSSLTSNPSRIIYTSEDTTETGDLHSSPVTWNTLGVVEMDYVPSAGVTQTGYFNLSGLAPQGSSGALVLAQTGINTMLRTTLDAGLLHPAGKAGHIPQLPLFQVTTGNPANQFTNPAAVTLTWASPVSWLPSIPVTQTLWTRWAGSNGAANWYTEEYPNYNPASVAGGPVTNSTYVEPVTLFYVPMWSSNGGGVWISAMDNATTLTPGNYYAPASCSTTQMAVTWSTPAASFPQATYQVRVDGFRQGYPLHYSYHEVDDISFTR